MHTVYIDGKRYVPADSVIVPPEDQKPPPEYVPDPGETPSEKEFDAAAFYDYIREHLFWGTLSQSQVDGINYIGAELAKAFSETDPVRLEKAAYCLATYQWETASTMQPIEEYGGSSARYAPWYGRGYVQLTWEENYSRQEQKHWDLGEDYHVHADRDRALIPEVSAVISIYGMIDGDFTGKKLDDYIKPGSVDYWNARRVVNGTDRAQEIADMAAHYEQALREGFT